MKMESSRLTAQNTGPNAARLRWGKANHNEDMQLAEIADAPINADADYLDDLDDLLNVISISGRDRHAALRPIAEPHARHTSSARSFVVSENDIAPYDLLLALPPARRNVPASLRSNPDDSLQSGIMNAWMAAEPPEVQKLAIAALTDRLTRLINRHFGGTSNGSGKERFKVDVFGSVSWDGNTGNGGDLDMVIRDRKFPQGCELGLGSLQLLIYAKYCRTTLIMQIARISGLQQAAKAPVAMMRDDTGLPQRIYPPCTTSGNW